MSNQPHNLELSGFLSLLCAGELSDNEHRSLLDRLEHDAAAREVYLRHMNLHAELTWRFDDRRESTVAAVASKRLSSPVLSILGSFVTTLARRSVIYSIALVGIAFYGIFFLLSFNLRPMFLPDVPVSVDKTAPVVAVARNQEGLNTFVRIGEPLRIDSGTMELELNSGTKLVVEGPADWSVDGDNNATLRMGRLIAKVPHDAIGFTLDTPAAKIIDLGTEFLATASPNGALTVHVISGEVAVTSVANGEQAQQNRNRIRLREGFGVVIEPGATSALKAIASPDEAIHLAQSLSGSRQSPKAATTRLISATFTPTLSGQQAKGAYLRLTSQCELESTGIAYQNRAATPGVLRVSSDGFAYLDLDCSTTGPLAQAEFTESGKIGRDETVLYVSWLFRADNALPLGWGGVSFLLSGDTQQFERLFVGKLSDDALGAADYHQGAFTPHHFSTTSLPNSLPLALDAQPHLMVMRIQFRKGPDEIALFLDPPWNGQEPATPSVKFVSVDDIEFDRLRFASGGGQKTWWFDDLRLGRHWSDVITAP